MLSQLNIQLIQQVFTKKYTTALVESLTAQGYSDAKPFNSVLQLGYTTNNLTLHDVYLTVQTKTPAATLSEYHVWLRPLSKEVYVAVDVGFKPIDEVYSFLNGGTGWYTPPLILDATRSW